MNKKGGLISLIGGIVIVLIIIVVFANYVSVSYDIIKYTNAHSNGECILDCKEESEELSCVESTTIWDGDDCECVLMRCFK